MKIVCCQVGAKVGDASANLCVVLDTIKKHKQADLIVFPELFITGYSLGDGWIGDDVQKDVLASLEAIKESLADQHIIVGATHKTRGKLYNSAFHISSQSISVYHKQMLAYDEIFDEKRYFDSGRNTYYFTIKNIKFALLICEDIWHKKILKKLANFDCLITINASVFSIDKDVLRKKIFTNFKKDYIYLNTISGQDEMIFDGGSFARIGGEKIDFAKFEEQIITIDYKNPNSIKQAESSKIEDIYNAISFATREFFERNLFQNVVIGISGGIDSAVVLAIARSFLPANLIHCFMLPYKFTSQLSLDLSSKLSQNLDVDLHNISIDELVDTTATLLEIPEKTLAFQNLQSRVRGLTLMTKANSLGHSLVLNTSNKSEIAVGYSTLYGDSVGGFSPLKDLTKTNVVKLARFINRDKEIIPVGIIDRPPSAELAEDQIDQDDLPPYDIIDSFIEKHIERGEKFHSPYKELLLRRLRQSEFKRFQSAPGPKITKKSFAKLDWRYPITRG